jgi:hypothetical protein
MLSNGRKQARFKSGKARPDDFLWLRKLQKKRIPQSRVLACCTSDFCYLQQNRKVHVKSRDFQLPSLSAMLIISSEMVSTFFAALILI